VHREWIRQRLPDRLETVLERAIEDHPEWREQKNQEVQQRDSTQE
jgi:hypothetical protein